MSISLVAREPNAFGTFLETPVAVCELCCVAVCELCCVAVFELCCVAVCELCCVAVFVLGCQVCLASGWAS